MTLTVVTAIATACSAIRNCEVSGNLVWQERWNARLDWIERNCLPSGSGFDAGSRIDRDASNATRLVLLTSFHHMDENGYYDGWTEHKVTIRASLIGQFHISVSGRDRNMIKDYVADCFTTALGAEIDWIATDGN